MRPPRLSAPIYLSGAAPPPLQEIMPAVRETCEKCKPAMGLLGATALGVTAAYFAPRFFDWALSAWRENGGGDPDDVEVIYEDE